MRAMPSMTPVLMKGSPSPKSLKITSNGGANLKPAECQRKHCRGYAPTSHLPDASRVGYRLTGNGSQFDIEVQGFTRQWMVGVQRDRLLIHSGDPNHENRAVLLFDLKLHSNCWLNGIRQVCATDLGAELFVVLAVCFFRRNDKILFLPDLMRLPSPMVNSNGDLPREVSKTVSSSSRPV